MPVLVQRQQHGNLEIQRMHGNIVYEQVERTSSRRIFASSSVMESSVDPGFRRAS